MPKYNLRGVMKVRIKESDGVEILLPHVNHIKDFGKYVRFVTVKGHGEEMLKSELKNSNISLEF